MSKHEGHDEKHAKPHGGGHGGGGHGGGGSHEEHEGAPEWLISFADNVTLMMGFFVIMLATNMGPKGGGSGTGPQQGITGGGVPPAFLDAQVAIRQAFHNPVNLNSMDPNDQVLISHIVERRGMGMAEQDGPPGDEHNLQSIRPSEYYRLCGRIPFDEFSTEIAGTGRGILSGVAKHLKGLRYLIEIRAHVSELEAHDEPDHGMRLAFERAMAVAEALSEEGLDWRQLRLISCADNDRLKPIIYGESGHEINQRVEIVLLDQVLPE